MEYRQTLEFEKEFRRLCRRFRSLEEDLEGAKRNAIELYHILQKNNNSIFPIPGFCFDDILICKLKKFACKSLKGRGVQSGIRIIYAFYPETTSVEFLEIYFKADKENENRERIKMYLNRSWNKG